MKNAQKIRENVVVDKKKSAYVIYEWPHSKEKARAIWSCCGG